MVTLKNIRKNNGMIECDYYPEDSLLSGSVKVNLDTEEIVKRTDPRGYEGNISYISHARKALVEMDGLNELPKKKKIMWY